MAPLLEAECVTAGYNRLPVVHDIDLHIKEGEIVALLGANGAGKTTTLRALLGDLPALRGTVRWCGQVQTVALHHRIRNGIGYLPEKRSVFMQLTVDENLRVGQGAPAKALELFPELRPHIKRRAGDLSGGQQQMLSLARVLAASPRLLVADELSLGLAPVIVHRLLDALVEAAKNGVAILFVEQHAELALQVASRAYVMRRGRVVSQGSASQYQGRYDELHRLYLADGGENCSTTA